MSDNENTLYSVLKTLGTTYPLSLPEDATFPCMVYQRISTVPQRNHSNTGYDKIRFQISIWAKKYADARTLAISVINALDINESDFIFSNLEDRQDNKEAETSLYYIFLDFFVWL